MEKMSNKGRVFNISTIKYIKKIWLNEDKKTHWKVLFTTSSVEISGGRTAIVPSSGTCKTEYN